MLELAHKQEGKLPWADLFAPAIALSENGFKVSHRLHALLRRKGPKHFNKDAQALYFDGAGAPRPIGFLLKNPAYGASLKQIATQGAKAFYQGALAQAIVKAAKNAPLKPSTMTLADLATYKPQQGSPLCTSYRRLNVCGSPLPSSGGLTIAQSLKLLEPFNLSAPKTPFLTQLKRVLDAQKLAFADRNHYMADPAFVPPPKGLLSEPYMQTRRSLFPLPNNGDKAPYGTPEKKKSSLGVDATIEASGTTHISIVDKEGNGISLTSSIESAFGSGQMAGGFLLNNQLTDFSFKPTDDQGRPIANRVEGGKRPRSSMSPTLVFDEQKNLKYVLGSPGGSRIIGYVLKSLIAMIDWGQTPQQAADLFNFANRNGLMELEASFNAQWIAKDLTAQKIPFRKASMTSGIHIIERKNGQLISGTDPRREGIAKGQ